VWGGEDSSDIGRVNEKKNLSFIGGEFYEKVANVRELIPGQPFVKDIGLGFMHTIVMTDK
jgi:hypothetical protein